LRWRALEIIAAEAEFEHGARPALSSKDSVLRIGNAG
jgi:hypothetical protein